jgi:hypothetical protein
MKSLHEVAADLGRHVTSVRRAALRNNIPMIRARAPSGQIVLAVDPRAEKQLRALYSSPLLKP